MTDARFATEHFACLKSKGNKLSPKMGIVSREAQIIK